MYSVSPILTVGYLSLIGFLFGALSEDESSRHSHVYLFELPFSFVRLQAKKKWVYNYFVEHPIVIRRIMHQYSGYRIATSPPESYVRAYDVSTLK